jgi:hypothetical protein
MDTEDVRATEAAVFDGPELVERGLADGVTTGRQLLAAIQDDFEDPDPDRDPGPLSGGSRANGQKGGIPMTEQNRKGGADTAAETYTKAEVDDLLAEAQSGQDTAVAEAQKSGAKAERERISAILGSESARTRPAMAHKLAFSDKGYSAEEAAELLESAAEEGPANGGDMLAQAMDGKTPGINADAGEETEEGEQASEPQPDADSIYAARRKTVAG